ncbi:hypothetical protein VNO80_17184 [Phaseolus coccineus]|uniref:Uncharacterized protein n=1 Tax=Phaseolus coccineus TaxID=3886 RepID=A0AAN9R3E6_PHACN
MFMFPGVGICGDCFPNVRCMFHNFIYHAQRPNPLFHRAGKSSYWTVLLRNCIPGGEKLVEEFMHTVTYEMHDFGCIELTLTLSAGFAGNL